MKPTCEVTHDGRNVEINQGNGIWVLTAQEAYDLYQAIGAVLPQCVQPFKNQP